MIRLRLYTYIRNPSVSLTINLILCVGILSCEQPGLGRIKKPSLCRWVSASGKFTLDSMRLQNDNGTVYTWLYSDGGSSSARTETCLPPGLSALQQSQSVLGCHHSSLRSPAAAVRPRHRHAEHWAELIVSYSQ